MPIQFNTGIAASINRNATGGNVFSALRQNGQVTGAAVQPKPSLFSLTAQQHKGSTALATLGMRASFMAAAQGQTTKLAGQLADLRDALKNRQNISTETGSKAETDPFSKLTRVQVEERFGLRERIEKRDAFVEEARFADRAVFETRDITEERAVDETRDITEERAVYETRDVTEQRAIYERRAIYNEATVTSTMKLDKGRVSAQGIAFGAQFKVKVGNGPEAQVTFVSDTQINLKIGSGPTQSFDFEANGKHWTGGLTDALNSIEGLSATINSDRRLELTTSDGSAITITNGSLDPLSRLGLVAGTTLVAPATITGTKDINKSAYQGWDDAGIKEGDKFSVRVGNGSTATVEFYKNEEIRLNLGDGSATQTIRFVDGGGAWRDGLLTALNRIGGIDASITTAGKLEIKSEDLDKSITVANVKGEALKHFGIGAGTSQGAISGYEDVQIGTETVVVGQQQVQTGTQTVVIGQEQVRSTQRVVVGQERVQVGTDRVQVGTHRFKIGTEDSVVQEKVSLGSVVRTVAMEETLTQTWNAPESNRKVAVSDKVERLAEDARETLQSLRESWTAAGMTLKLDAESLGVEKGFVETLTSEQAIRDRISIINRGLNQVEEGGSLRGATATMLQADKPAASTSVIEEFDRAADQVEQNKQGDWLAQSVRAGSKPELASRAFEPAARMLGGYAQNASDAKKKDKVPYGRLERVI